MPQNEYIEKAIKQHGRQFDYEERTYEVIDVGVREKPEWFIKSLQLLKSCMV